MTPLREEKSGYFSFKLNAVFKGVIAALIITILGCTISGIFYHVTSLTEKTLPVTATSLFYLSIFLGSVFAAREAGCKGLLHGIAVALLFIVLGLLIAKAFLHMGVTSIMLLQKGFFSLMAGAVGGVLGVGLSK
ncbi:TIGR04086 family membrane protein [Desulfallas sp. Bu1-1]|jgi:putative membrane protein (TIGR04086 family)|uniref:TIGR04086 family membrane protein n=1 Tax=Desulfallas sp. Bu1-1 TaxID=2787620 RepID=UPI0018A0A108|nr:TIGR04086 family membrane protein [Desulfallas sp. Bu1-1]MBF7083319.1 TIGR04086 family membrane protein [Desulfallas sp. Bu1-1]